MSFKCSTCGKQQPEGSKPNDVSLEIRKVKYPKRFEYDNPSRDVIDTGGFGTERAKSGKLCDKCFVIHVPRILSDFIKKDNPTKYEERNDNRPKRKPYSKKK